MTRLLELLISIAIVAVLFLVVGVVLPSSRQLTESVETNRKMSIVFDTINSLRRFDDWSPLVLRDPEVDLKLSGPESGVGARLDFASTNENIGKGSWEITESEQDARVVYTIEDEHRGDNKRTAFTLTPTGRNNRNVEITQTFNVDYGWDLLGRYAGMYVSRNVGDDMKLGLGRLSNMLASVPNVDYRVDGAPLTGLQFVDLPAEHLLVVNAGAIERNNEIIKTSMKANMEWIKRTMDASGLVAVGPMRIITTELARDTYTYDVAQAVRRGSAADGEDDDADAEDAAEGSEDAGDAAAEQAAPVAAADAGAALEGVKLQGPVTYVQTTAGRAARGSYVGYMAELENVRNAVRAWAMTQGEEAVGRPYEVYKNGIDAAFTDKGEFDVYWQLKQP